MNVNAIKGAAYRILVVAAKLPAWIESMSPASRKAYLKAHPDSKYASQLGGGSKPEAKPKAAPAKTAGSGDKVADKHNATIKQAAADARDVRAQIKSLKEQLPDPIETRADKAKDTRINKKIQEQMEHLKHHKATGDKAKALLEKRNAAKTAPPKTPNQGTGADKGDTVKPNPPTAKPAAKPKSDPAADKIEHKLMDELREGKSRGPGSAASKLVRHITKLPQGEEHTDEQLDAQDAAESAIDRHGIDSPQAAKALTELRTMYGKANLGKTPPKPKPARPEYDEPEDREPYEPVGTGSYRRSPGSSSKGGSKAKPSAKSPGGGPGKGSAPLGRRRGKGGAYKPSAKNGGSPARAPGRG